MRRPQGKRPTPPVGGYAARRQAVILPGLRCYVPRGEGGWRVKHRAVFLLLAVAVALLMASGVALAKTFHCDGGRCRGTNSADTIYGSAKRDAIYSLGGADLVRGDGGADSINGDGGRDRLSGGHGNDGVFGGDDDDLVAGNKGFDTLNAGNGDDRIEAVDGMTDQITCGNGSHDIVVFDRRIDNLRDRRECEVKRPR